MSVIVLRVQITVQKTVLHEVEVKVMTWEEEDVKALPLPSHHSSDNSVCNDID